MFAGWKPDLTGEPWDDWQDANLMLDFNYGCSVFAMAKRARRSEAEIEARLVELGLDLEKQPKPKKRRSWIGH